MIAAIKAPKVGSDYSKIFNMNLYVFKVAMKEAIYLKQVKIIK